ncbi:MAG: hypothetical protein WCA58_19515 [Terriglobales bacterium]
MRRLLLRHGGIVLTAGVALALFAVGVRGQTSPVERTFRAPRSAVEKALQQLQPVMSGHLPTLEGFVQVGDHPLSHYQRAFYQCAVQVNETPAGSVVRVSTDVTAWYKDANSARSGYQLLKSNGRIEADLLDQLSDQLSGPLNHAEANAAQKSARNAARAPRVGFGSGSGSSNSSDLPVISTPLPSAPESIDTVAPSSPALPAAGSGIASQAGVPRPPADATPADKKTLDLRAEVSSLEDAVRNQSRPKNLVAIKKSGTPVVASPSLSGKTLFLADAQDEFEMLDFNADWVHVRISGLSRGWIWRTSLEMPEGIPDVPTPVATAAPTAADLFQVSREEMAPFPGDWAPLRGKSVKIISVQKIREDEKGGGASAKLEFAKSLLDSSYEELAKSPDVAGLVLIFDSVDGGMIAATLPTIRKWKAGGLTDAALWHQCYFDPPETFTISSAATGH